jgi:ribosome maturation factor RimP
VTEASQRDPRATAQAVIRLLEPELQAAGFELLDVRLFRGGGRVQLRVYVDTAEGVSLDAVAKASRTVGMLLEEADLFPEAYVIEVSSPGIRRPLRTAAHFAAVVGEKVDLKLATRKARLRGVLSAFADDVLTIQPAAPQDAAADAEAPAAIAVALEELLEANLDPDFDAQAIINADRRRRKEDKRQERRERPQRRKSRPRRRDEPEQE